jgi:hypothetical protein
VSRLPFAKTREKCNPGKPIKGIAELIKVLQTEPSVWYFPSHRPMPSAGMLNWQARVLINAVRNGAFGRCVRPKPMPVLP